MKLPSLRAVDQDVVIMRRTPIKIFIPPNTLDRVDTQDIHQSQLDCPTSIRHLVDILVTKVDILDTKVVPLLNKSNSSMLLDLVDWPPLPLPKRIGPAFIESDVPARARQVLQVCPPCLQLVPVQSPLLGVWDTRITTSLD